MTRSTAIVLFATFLIVIVLCTHDFSGRLADDVQRLAGQLNDTPGARLDEFPGLQVEHGSRELERWAPADSAALLFSFGPVGYVVAAGLAIAFLTLAGSVQKRNLLAPVVLAIAVAGCAAATFGDLGRKQAFKEAQGRLAQWREARTGSSDWVVGKDAFLAALVLLQRYTLLMNAGLIAVGVGLVYLAAVAAEASRNTTVS
jgi:hypothetical protein